MVHFLVVSPLVDTPSLSNINLVCILHAKMNNYLDAALRALLGLGRLVMNKGSSVAVHILDLTDSGYGI